MKSKLSLLLQMCLAVGVAVLATGCQTYSERIKAANLKWHQGNPVGAAKDFTKLATDYKDGKDTVILRLEQGAALRAAGQYQESIAAFDAAEEKINRYDEKAKISVGQQAGALLSNQDNLPYEGRDYDRVMLNTYKALNYLQLGDRDKARVEFIRAAQRQQDAEENNKRRIEKAEAEIEKLKDSKEKGAADGKVLADKANADAGFQNNIATQYGYLDGFQAKAVYVNPFVYYVSGIYFLAAHGDQSDLSRARDAFRFTLGSIGENKFIKQDLELVDQAAQGGTIPPTTYVIFETGCAPERGQIRIPVPLFLAGVKRVPFVNATFPTLNKQDGQLSSLNVTALGATETTLPLASMDSAVGQDFKNELPTIITKTLVSAGIKAAAVYAINKQMENEDAWAQVIVKILLIATQAAVDIADTRTWNTLPKEFQFCRIPTPPDRKIQLSGPGGMVNTEVTVTEDKINLIYVKSISQNSPLLVSVIRFTGTPSPSVNPVVPAEPVQATAPVAITPASRPPATVSPTASEPPSPAPRSVVASPSDSKVKKSSAPKPPKTSGPVFQDVPGISSP